MTERLLDVDDLSAGYGDALAVRNFSLSVDSGQVVCLLGPNGAGKTTTLLAIMGLIRSRSGTVRFFQGDERRTSVGAIVKSGVAFVPDDRGLCPGLTVEEHFRLSRRRGSTVDPGMVYEHFPQLLDLRKRPAGLLSGGEQQMLAVAKALVAGPRLLLIDEMSLGLAPKVVQTMFPAVRSLAAERGIGVILVEQHTDVALQHSDRGIVLNHGAVVLEGRADALLADRKRMHSAYFG
jgi:branched-chain amino acid transport system ATP-binding protein